MTDERLKQLITEYIDEHEEEMLSDLMALIRINSEKAAPESDKPYGVGAYDALMAAKSLCEHYGFTTKVYDNRVVSADMTQYAPQLDILAHMDVVPAGDGWTVCAPYTPVIRDGAIYGRGSSDDKGPAIAALYAMRAVRELGIPLSRNCRLILGSDEETGSSDIEHYYSLENEAPMTFSPDAEFPVINVEKGRLSGKVRWRNPAADAYKAHQGVAAAAAMAEEGKEASRQARTDKVESETVGSETVEPKTEKAEIGSEAKTAGKAVRSADCVRAAEVGVRLISCASGHTINIVPDKAEAVLAGIGEKELAKIVQMVKDETGAEFTYEIKEGLSIFGTGAHASTPEKGTNALTLMLAVLAKLPFADKGFGETLAKLAALFPYGDHDGAAIGAACEDNIAGKTTVSPDILTADENEIVLKFDARTCIKAEEPDTDSAASIRNRVEQEGFEFEYGFVHAHAVDGDSEFIRTLLSCYETVTGRPGACMAVGGGTYVHELKNGVAFGAVGETTDTHMHGADEFMLISELKDAAVIYALAIARLCS